MSMLVRGGAADFRADLVSGLLVLTFIRLPFLCLYSPTATVFRTGDTVAYRSMCRMYTLLHAGELPSTIQAAPS